MVELEPVSDDAPGPEAGSLTGTGLCLSGGGYRAMLFHCGTLLRLHETGKLFEIDRISSVSGGSIMAAKLALEWEPIAAQPTSIATLQELVIDPILAMASTTIDVWAGISGVLLPGRTISQGVSKAYDKHLYRGARLSDLPAAPHFTLCATNLQTTGLLRFNRFGITDWHIGNVVRPELPLAQAVTASSAFPPFLAPCRIDAPASSNKPLDGADLAEEPYITRIVAADGGVYDNLGLETLWKRCETILVSDAGAKISPKPKPHTDWLLGTKRAADIIDDQVRNLRKRTLINAYSAHQRKGAYWGIRSDIARYHLANTLPCPRQHTLALAEITTRLAAMPRLLQLRLVNWGYAVCDAGLRRHVDPSISPPVDFPYPDAGIG